MPQTVIEIPKDTVLSSVVSFLKTQFHSQLKDIVFFGSRARGDSSIESDYDFIVIFKSQVSNEMKDIIRNFVIENLLEKGIVLNLISISSFELEEMRFEPFVMNAFKEGVLLG